MICDTLLDQNIFSGVRNITKNNVLFRIHVHRESIPGKIPVRKIKELVDEIVVYSFQFLEWKKNYELKKQWLAHTKNVVRDVIYNSQRFLHPGFRSLKHKLGCILFQFPSCYHYNAEKLELLVSKLNFICKRTLISL